MKKLKYRFLKAIAVALKCEELIDWDEYTVIVPRKYHEVYKDGTVSSYISPNIDLLNKIYRDNVKPGTPYLSKLKELGFKRPDMQKAFEHYEESK